MSLIRVLARPLLASTFIADGLAKVKSASAPVPEVSALTRRAADALPFEVGDATASRAVGITQVAAGALYAFGKLPRLAALVLAGSAAVQTFVDAKEPSNAHETGWRRERLVKNLAILGGALLAVVDTNGKPSVAWRVQEKINNHSKED